MEAGNNRQMALILKQYKLPDGAINFPAVLGVPISERLPALYKTDFLYTTGLVVAALTLAFERMSFKKKMTGVIINNIAEEILFSADEDNLSMEDLLLFLQNMVRGKYGNIEELSISRFMNLFDKYRDLRHSELLLFRENQHLQFKGMGTAERVAKSDPMSEHLSNISGRISEMKDALQDKKESETMKKADKYYGKE